MCYMRCGVSECVNGAHALVYAGTGTGTDTGTGTGGAVIQCSEF